MPLFEKLYSAGQEIYLSFVEAKGSVPCLKEPVAGLHTEPDDTNHNLFL
jgi:hypothetical protein